MSKEFTNTFYDFDKTLRHCFRVQAARCHEYLIFIRQMKRKYTNFNMAFNEQELIFFNTSGWKNVENQTKMVDVFEQTDRNIFAVKYARMLEAKKLFERLGGEYEKYR